MTPWRRIRVAITWILDNGIAKTIERTLLGVAIVSGLVLFLYAVVNVANQDARSLGTSLDSLLKVTLRLQAETAALKARAQSGAPSPRSILRP